MNVLLLVFLSAVSQDATGQAAASLTFLSDLKTGRLDAARQHLSSNARFESRSAAHRPNLEGFASWTSDCEFKQIKAMTGRTASPEMPLLLDWSCRFPEDDRQAAIYVVDGKIDRIAFGPLVSINVSSMPSPSSR